MIQINLASARLRQRTLPFGWLMRDFCINPWAISLFHRPKARLRKYNILNTLNNKQFSCHIPSKITSWKELWASKKCHPISPSPIFPYFLLLRIIGHQENGTIIYLSKIENLPTRSSPVDKSAKSNEAYPPILLMKCLLLQ